MNCYRLGNKKAAYKRNKLVLILKKVDQNRDKWLYAEIMQIPFVEAHKFIIVVDMRTKFVCKVIPVKQIYIAYCLCRYFSG